MKKTISGVLLALTAVFALVACGKKKDNTTKQGGDDKKKGTISFYVWNDEFKTRLNELYPENFVIVPKILQTNPPFKDKFLFKDTEVP
jgi:hypothetical protein